MAVQIFVDHPLTEIRNKRNEIVKKVCLLARLVTKGTGNEASAGQIVFEDVQPTLSAPFTVSSLLQHKYTSHRLKAYMPHASSDFRQKLFDGKSCNFGRLTKFVLIPNRYLKSPTCLGQQASFLIHYTSR